MFEAHTFEISCLKYVPTPALNIYNSITVSAVPINKTVIPANETREPSQRRAHEYRRYE
jgi:hypothetical protein